MYISGCLGIDPKTNNLVSGGVEPEAHQVLCYKFDKLLVLLFVMITRIEFELLCHIV